MVGGDGEVVDSAPACLPVCLPAWPKPSWRLLAGSVKDWAVIMLKNRAVFFPPPPTPLLAAVGGSGVLFMQAQCFLFMLPCCGDSVPDQGQIRKKSFSHQNKMPPPLFISSDLFLFFVHSNWSLFRYQRAGSHADEY